MNPETLLTRLAEYRNLASRVGPITGDFWTVFYESQNDNLFRPVRIVLIPLCELPLVNSSKSTSLCRLASRYFIGRSFSLSEQCGSRLLYQSLSHPST
jgi:hypothetical protein